jgi:hypothetical protein
MNARERLLDALNGNSTPMEPYESLIDAYAHELAEKIQAAMEEIRAADWGKSSRSKRPYLQGMERAKKVITPEVLNSE